MKKIIASTLLFSLLLSVVVNPVTVYAWNSTGHRVIAAIAWEHLTPTAKENIINILKHAPDDSDLLDLYDEDEMNAEKYFFMNASYWPDIVRDRDERERYEKYHEGNWHYIGSYWKQTEDGPVKTDGQVDDENIVERINHFKKTLADPNVSDQEKAIQIAWVLHLVGDIHMPLHNTSRVTEETPDGDRGGNSFRLGDDWPWNLHAYWDGILDLASPKPEEMNDFVYYLEHAEQISEMHPKTEFEEMIKVQKSTDWNEEGKQITMNNLYPEDLEQNQQPSEQYEEMALDIAQKQIALSGYRMAEFLNQIFGE